MAIQETAEEDRHDINEKEDQENRPTQSFPDGRWQQKKKDTKEKKDTKDQKYIKERKTRQVNIVKIQKKVCEKKFFLKIAEASHN